MSTTVKIQLNNTQQILEARNLETGGKAQQFFCNEVWRLSDDYVPFDNYILGTNVSIASDGSSITYNSPYAQYQWSGVAMEGNPRTATKRSLKYQGAPMRGREWTTRMYADRGNEILKATADFVGGKVE